MLNNNKVTENVQHLLDIFEESQWNHVVNFEYASSFNIMTRSDLRNLKMKKHLCSTRTSGSTGESVTVEKTILDHIWYIATNIREIRWRKWDVTKNIAIVRPGRERQDKKSWGIPNIINKEQGKSFVNGYAPISELQCWLEEKNPHYLHCAPSIVAQLDLSKIPNLIDIKGTGEAGGSMYSSEECGTISIRCPDNPDFHHVMENHIVEVDSDGGIIITTTTNPYIKRYKHGDHVELGECTCGRKLQTIKKINGRVRNMFVLPNGDKKWPLFGSRDYYERFGIKRYKIVQTTLHDLEAQIISDPLGDKEEDFIGLIKDTLNSPINVKIKYVNEFPMYKFEEFVSLVSVF
jgi:phenylacetate-CoA ligase